MLEEFSELVMLELETHLKEAQARAVYGSISEIVTLMDRSGTILFANEAVERALGFTPDAVVGQNAFDLVYPQDRDRMETIFTKVVARAGSGLSVEGRFPDSDGSWRWFNLAYNNRLDDPNLVRWSSVRATSRPPKLNRSRSSDLPP
jgi:PAS domain S-box-containing protein